MRGEFDMHRFVPSEVDARIREFLAGGDSAELDEDDGYTLLTFVRRSVLGVMRGHEDASLDEARAAAHERWTPTRSTSGT